ncbi:hypothetical protein SAMN05216326_12718 [Nitrosomonas marina]|uniref:Uncharacterized protein n=1 Tax=Nitrosomonas marina TaxID=917 RepID=A0A1I0EI40_9PROT|nr:hypothetical protein [Nitrosomonas marina]SET44104.1 hypothetical protein SAMN05216326_12718 [Nitrosomonas marina]
MAATKYTELSNKLSVLLAESSSNSESQNAIACSNAVILVNESALTREEKNAVVEAIGNTANPSGYYYENNGIQAGLDAIKKIETEVSASQSAAPTRLNLKNLKNLVSDGTIFSVEFIKRSNGELRKMICRLGVKKHLRGGDKAYNAKHHNLLTVFDMEKGGYRSIPVDAIQRLCVNGQAFSFGEVPHG